MNAQGTTARLSIMVTPDVKRRLEAEAQAKKTTVGDLVRRRLDGEPNAEERQFITALADLGQRAKAVLARVDATHDSLVRERAALAGRVHDVRAATLASLTESDRAALSTLFPGAPALKHGARS